MAGAAHANELRPMEAASLAFGDVTGVTFFKEEDSGYPVVTTLSAGERGTPVRFVTTLQPGQRAMVSVPREVGQEAIEVEITRVGDVVQIMKGQKLSSMN